MEIFPPIFPLILIPPLKLAPPLTSNIVFAAKLPDGSPILTNASLYKITSLNPNLNPAKQKALLVKRLVGCPKISTATNLYNK